MTEEVTHKPCSSCRTLKPFKAFHKGGGKYGLNSQCKECRKLAENGLAPHQQIKRFKYDDEY